MGKRQRTRVTWAYQRGTSLPLPHNSSLQSGLPQQRGQTIGPPTAVHEAVNHVNQLKRQRKDFKRFYHEGDISHRVEDVKLVLLGEEAHEV